MSGTEDRVEAPSLPVSVLADAAHWSQYLDEWARALGDSGEQRWRAEIADWASGSTDHEGEHRAARVMRKLRRVAPREYDVLYRMLVSGESFEEITAWLNDRARQHGFSTSYTVSDTTALFVAGIGFAQAFF
jgi:hypothetical protein